MMTANLVGFVFGVDDARALWGIMLGGPEGALFPVHPPLVSARSEL